MANAGAVMFFPDGRLYCTSLKRNWDQLNNLIAYGCGQSLTMDGDSNAKNWDYSKVSSIYQWGSSNLSLYNSAAKCRYGYRLNSQDSYLRQTLNCIKGYNVKGGHRYYFSCWYGWSTPPSASRGHANIKFRIKTSDGVTLYLGAIDTITYTTESSHYTNAFHFSTVFEITKDSGEETYYQPTISIEQQSSNYSAGPWVTKLVLVDLKRNLYPFSGYSNNEIKEYCDTHIREINTIVGANLAVSAYRPIFKTTGGFDLVEKINYATGEGEGPSEDPGNNWAISECFWDASFESANEAYFYSDPSLTLTKGSYYYGSIYTNDQNSYSTITNDWYYPIAEPSLSSAIPVPDDGTSYSGEDFWHLVSAYGKRDDWTATSSAQARFDVNNTPSYGNAYYSYWGFLAPVDTMLARYNTLKGSSVTVNYAGVNKYFFDCWFDGWSQPVLHFIPPITPSIKFDTEYNIQCMDVIIEPEIDKVYFDDYGRIHCRSLEPTSGMKKPFI